MRTFLFLAAMGSLALPAGAAPVDASGALRGALRGIAPMATMVYWHAGGTTAWGNHWHAGGTGAYGAHPTYAYHGYGGAYHGYYRAPVVVAPAPAPVGSFAAGAVVGGMAGAAMGAAAASPSRPAAATTVYNYGQPPTVINNYYNN